MITTGSVTFKVLENYQYNTEYQNKIQNFKDLSRNFKDVSKIQDFKDLFRKTQGLFERLIPQRFYYRQKRPLIRLLTIVESLWNKPLVLKSENEIQGACQLRLE